MIEIMPKMTMNIATTATAMIVRSLAVTKRLSAHCRVLELRDLRDP